MVKLFTMNLKKSLIYEESSITANIRIGAAIVALILCYIYMQPNLMKNRSFGLLIVQFIVQKTGHIIDIYPFIYKI